MLLLFRQGEDEVTRAIVHDTHAHDVVSDTDAAVGGTRLLTVVRARVALNTAAGPASDEDAVLLVREREAVADCDRIAAINFKPIATVHSRMASTEPYITRCLYHPAGSRATLC